MLSTKILLVCKYIRVKQLTNPDLTTISFRPIIVDPCGYILVVAVLINFKRGRGCTKIVDGKVKQTNQKGGLYDAIKEIYVIKYEYRVIMYEFSFVILSQPRIYNFVRGKKLIVVPPLQYVKLKKLTNLFL